MKDALRVPGICLLAAGWTFLVWRLAGMPDPGGMGRFLPLSWVLCAAMSVSCRRGGTILVSMAVFTLFAYLWRVIPWAPYGASAASAGGLLATGLSAADRRFGVVRAVLPAAFLMTALVPFTSDEVRFAEVAAGITGANGYEFTSRPGDPAPEDSHHTIVYPLIIAPGIMFGRVGMRIMGLLPVIGCALLLQVILKRSGSPFSGPAAAAAVLLMPGFTLLGPALSGWTAAGAICAFAFLPGGKKGFWGTVVLACFLVALKMRYSGAALGMLAAWYIENSHGRRKLLLLPLAALVLAIVVIILDRVLLDGGLLWVRYGNIETLMAIEMNLLHRPAMLVRSAFHMLFDMEAGLLPKAPWIIAALAGLPLLRRADGRLFMRLALPALCYALVHLVWTGESWHGLPAPATRVFLPMVPLFAASCALVLDRRTTRILVAVSIAISAFVAAYPEARFNMASGTDNMMRIVGASGTGVSMIRPSDPLIILWAAFTAMAVFLVVKNNATCLKVLLLAVAFALALPAFPGRIEAEDAGPSIVHGALTYPGNPDPAERLHWFFSRERMLVLSHHDQFLMIRGGQPVSFSAAGAPGALLIAGTDTIDVGSDLREMPGAYRMMRKASVLPDRPENRIMNVYCIDAPRPFTIRIPRDGLPVYFDWLTVGDI